ncbi:uncharacterized protein [Temnothorax nylanderi]|uniref:uncharacterized protein n=1 Tax=Temnothorax nylanderi TaxID=102681 RepID=UPI003A88CF38
MDSMTLSEAKSKRTHIRAAATRLKTYLDCFNIQQGSRHDIAERKNKLSELWNQFDLIQTRIEPLENGDESITDKDALLAQQIQHRDSFETPYFNLMSRYESILQHFDRHEDRATPFREGNAFANGTRESRIKLPKIDLPVFSGAYDNWYSYQDTFEKLIHTNDALTEIEKFHYLRSSLKDKAAEIIKSIETTSDNYHEAWTAVKERFDNKRWIIQKHIRAIFDAPALTKENHVNLRELLDTILNHLRALKAIKRPTESWDDLIIHIIVSKLDSTTKKAWETSIPDNEVPNLKSLTDFLSKRCQALDAIFGKMSVSQSAISSKPSNKSKSLSATNVITSNFSCPQCKENHALYHCEAFLKLPVEKRIQIVKRAQLCMNCLRSTAHRSRDCNSSTCRQCQKKHNTLLHLSSASNTVTSISNEPQSSEAKQDTQPIATQCLSDQQSRAHNTVLSTAIIHVFDSNNQVVSCRALLDSGSQVNFVTQQLANRLHIKEQPIQMSVSGIVDRSIQAQRAIHVCVKSRFNRFSEKLQCIILPKITHQLPQRFIHHHEVKIPNIIKLVDPNFNVPSDIDMLIGSELFWKLICAGQIRSSRTQPTLQKTHLG